LVLDLAETRGETSAAEYRGHPRSAACRRTGGKRCGAARA
jgi:hypothetical protein